MTVSDGSSPMMFGGDCMGGGFIWAFLIFALLMGNGGFGFGGGNGNSNAIQNDINRGFEAQNTMANQREILSATNNVYHDVVANLGDKYSELQRDISAVQVTQGQILANQNQCCCETKMAIAQNRYDDAMNTASINANVTAQTQKILDSLAQNKIESLQNKVNYLETQALLGNVVRYPTQTTYTAGGSPFCNCGGFNGYPLYS